MRILTLCFLAASLIVLSVALPARGQSLSYETAAFATGATEYRLPFWLSANTNGLVAPEGPNAGFLLGGQYEGPSTSGLRYLLRADVFARASEDATARLYQLYGRLQYGAFVLTAGQWTDTSVVRYPELSLGAMTWSTNAAPMPKVALESDGYLGVPGTNGYLAVRGRLAHGWFEDDRFVERPWLHEKFAYLRLLPPALPLQGHIGVVHMVQWGGAHPTLGDLPDGAGDYVDVFLGRAADAGGPGGEVINALGNTVGSYDAMVTFQLPTIHGSVYRQFFIETSPSARFRSPWDGLWGLYLTRPETGGVVQSVLYQHLYTRRQNSKYTEGEPPGADRYYNNFLYQDGWTYQGRTLGIPLLFPDPASELRGIINNMVVAHHLAATGALGRAMRYRALATYSRNYGARTNCNDNGCSGPAPLVTPRRDQLSLLLELDTDLPWAEALRGYGRIGLDVGEVYDDNVGLQVGLRWSVTPSR